MSSRFAAHAGFACVLALSAIAASWGGAVAKPLAASAFVVPNASSRPIIKIACDQAKMKACINACGALEVDKRVACWQEKCFNKFGCESKQP